MSMVWWGPDKLSACNMNGIFNMKPPSDKQIAKHLDSDEMQGHGLDFEMLTLLENGISFRTRSMSLSLIVHEPWQFLDYCGLFSTPSQCDRLQL